MIEEQKVLAAFTYAAYSARQCGNELSPGVREKNMARLRDYVREGLRFPQEVIEQHPRLNSEVKVQGVINYIFRGHLIVLKEADPAGSLVTLADVVKSDLGYKAALSCAVNFYRVESVEEDHLLGVNLATKRKKKLEIMAGLELPSPGQTVSGHWNHYLRVENPDDPAVRENMRLNREYIAHLDELRDKKE